MNSAKAQPSGVSLPVFLGVDITFIVLTGVFVAIRVASNIKTSRKPLLDDYAAIFAVLLIGATYGVDNKVVDLLHDPKATPLALTRMGVAINFLSGFSMIASKTPILLLYVRLFGIQAWLKLWSYITLGVLTLLMLVSMITIGAVCAPRSSVVSVAFLMNCSTYSARNGLACGFLSLVVDIVIFILPLPVVTRLRLPTNKKVGLVIVFASGVVAIAASAVSVAFKYYGLSGTSTDMTTAMFCTIIEWCISVMVGCVPALYSFWVTVVVTSGFYTAISSVFSSTMSFTRNHNRSSKRSQDSGHHSLHSEGQSTDHMVEPSGYKNSFSQSDQVGTTIVPLREVKVQRH